MIKFRPKTKIIKDRVPAIRAAVNRMNRAQVKIGWETNETYPGTETTVAQVAIWNEYGTQGHRRGDKQVGAIPARPFMRQAYANNLKQILGWQLEARDKVLSGEWSVEKALLAIGFRFQEALRTEIVKGNFEANRASTLDRKKNLGQGGRPLIATRRMLNAIRTRLDLNGESTGSTDKQDSRASQQNASATKRQSAGAARQSQRRADRKFVDEVKKLEKKARAKDRNLTKRAAKLEARDARKAKNAVRQAKKVADRRARKARNMRRNDAKKAFKDF